MNPYEVLEVPVGASAEEIKAAYHGMAKKWHPDRYTGAEKVEAERRFRLLAEAYSILKDSGRPEERPQTAAGPAATPPAPPESAAEQPPQHKSADDWYQDAKAAAAARAFDKALGLLHYAIRLDGEKAEYHALLGKLLEDTGGDKRLQVRALETALRLVPRDVESAILLARTYQSLGMHARASRLWDLVRRLAPNHPVFAPPPKPPAGKPNPGKGESAKPGLGEQFAALADSVKSALSRIIHRG